MGEAALRGALECGVRTAYAVIDDYMKRGYEAARNNSSQNGNSSHGGEKNPMSNEKPNYTNWTNPWGPMSPLMEQWTMAMRAWTDAWSAFIPGARPGGWPVAGNASASGYSAGGNASCVSVEVASPKPTEVAVSLKPGMEQANLSADSFVPALTGVAVCRKAGRVHVKVTVAADQAPGRYTGVLRAADGSIAGDLAIVISSPPSAA
jgi:hypothetical protein